MQETTSVIVTIGVYFVFSAAADAMLPPESGKERGWYGWFYRFVQTLAANASKLARARYPSLGAVAGDAGATGSATAISAESTTKRVTVIQPGGAGAE